LNGVMSEVEELKDKHIGPPGHGNPKPGWDHQFKRHFMVRNYVNDYTAPYNNMLMSYSEHSQIQRYSNGWIPSGTDTAYEEQWDTLYYLHDEKGSVDKVIGQAAKNPPTTTTTNSEDP